MKFYIVDDDQAILYVLQNIIEQNFNDEVVGMTTDPARPKTSFSCGTLTSCLPTS